MIETPSTAKLYIIERKKGWIVKANTENVLLTLASKRPVFHSEADFQFALAWEIHLQDPDCLVRLEYKPSFMNQRIYLDIFIRALNSKKVIVFELKYKTRGLDVEIGGEGYNLLDQSAQDLARYDFLKDISRLENMMTHIDKGVGYALFLTNDSAYWKPPLRGDTIDADFRIHSGRVLNGDLKWKPRASKGTTHGREAPVSIRGSYDLKWQDYSRPSRVSYGRFRYLLVKVAHEDKEGLSKNTPRC